MKRNNNDRLTEIIDRARSRLADTDLPTKKRIVLLWAAAKASRELAASDVVRAEFLRLAVDVGLITVSGRWATTDVRESILRYGADDVEHVISWALRGLNPFETGRLQ
jgi:hypothetical protein